MKTVRAINMTNNPQPGYDFVTCISDHCDDGNYGMGYRGRVGSSRSAHLLYHQVQKN
jgi:hypothetical protein